MKASEAVTTFGETLNELKHRFTRLVWCWHLLLLRTIQVYLQLWLWLYRIRVMRLLSSRHFGLAWCVPYWFRHFFKCFVLGTTGNYSSANWYSEVLLVAANTSGGVTGKMISPQSIAIACAAVGLVGKESDLFRFTVKHSIIFTVFVGIIITVQAYLVPWMIP